MLSKDTQEYLEKWNEKAKAIVGDDLNHIFERFGTYYKIFGRLYNDVSKNLIDQGIIKKKGGDQKAATENLIIFLSANRIMDELQLNNNEDIASLINVLPYFKIKFTSENIYEKETDKQLLKELQSLDDSIKVRSILKIIYFIRCNYEHSRKNFENHQSLLLEPITNLLRTLNFLLQKQLSN